jgi:hypothetical protein
VAIDPCVVVSFHFVEFQDDDADDWNSALDMALMLRVRHWVK